MNGKELDRKYKGDFPNECVAEKADTERLMNETGPLDGTKEATEKLLAKKTSHPLLHT